MVSPAKCISGRSVADWIAAYPVVSDLCALKETDCMGKPGQAALCTGCGCLPADFGRH